jgi:hypothetical protein
MHRLLGVLGLGFAAAGEEHEAPHPVLHRQLGEGADHLHSSRRGEVRVVRDVRPAHALECGRPRGFVFPVERRLPSAGTDPDGHSKRLQAFGHPPTCLPCAAEHKRRFHGHHLTEFRSFRNTVTIRCSVTTSRYHVKRGTAEGAR